jgi:ankyrin repeat protein
MGKLFLAGLLLATTMFSTPPDTRLADAAMNGDRAAVLAMLKPGVDVNVAQGDGSTALHWSAYRGDLEMTQALLKAGANIKAVTRIGSMSPLFMAAKGGNAAVIEALLKAGGNALEANANGTTVLMTAASTGNPDAVKVLLDRGADINARDLTNGQTALMFAAAVNRAAVIKTLIARGADPNVTTKVVRMERVQVDANGNPLPPAEGNRGGAAADGAQRGGGGGQRGGGDRILGATVRGGLSALHFAAREGQMDAIRELTAGGADVNLQSAGDKTPPITEAIINGHLDIAKYLLDHGANPKIANADGLTPLFATVDIRWRANAWYPQPTIAEEKTDYIAFMKDLLDHGADVNARLGRKLWFRKFRYGDDWVDPNGATAFWRAAQANDVAAMRFLAAHGADPKLATVKGVTPLMVAAGIGFEYQLTNIVPDSRFETVKYLVEEAGNDVNAKDEKDYTTLHGTAYVGDNEVIKYLVGKGANVKARAKGRLGGTQGAEDVAEGQGDTVADMANGPREKSLLHPETVKLLESLGSENSNDCRSTACVNKTKVDKPPVRPQ